MKIAFYAPLKSPHHPTPSGDRAMARLLMAALSSAGHSVTLACTLRSRVGDGDRARQDRLARLGQRIAGNLLARYARTPDRRPDLWLTYHLYYKAPDWIGPHVARALGIPYALAEASLAPRRADGPWAASHAAVIQALEQAAGVLSLNPVDAAGLTDALSPGCRTLSLPPFLPLLPPPPPRALNRPPRLVAVGMMRQGDKAASYRLLAESLALLRERDWTIDLIGDGPARAEITAAFAPLGPRVRLMGSLPPEGVRAALLAADLCVWPAINEAYGMALLEAQMAGLPVVAGDSGGVHTIVRHGTTGLLTPPGDAPAFAAALAALLDDPARCRSMGDAAAATVQAQHGFTQAADRLDQWVRSLP